MRKGRKARKARAHINTTSGCPLDLIAQGIRKVVDIALKMSRERPNQIKFIDIGGGYDLCSYSPLPLPSTSRFSFNL